MVTTSGKRPKLEPLDIKCTSSNCDQGLHCFRATRKMKARNEQGACRTCGKKLVDWERVRKRDLSDAAHTIRMLPLYGSSTLRPRTNAARSAFSGVRGTKSRWPNSNNTRRKSR